jgi:hypothetical protein
MTLRIRLRLFLARGSAARLEAVARGPRAPRSPVVAAAVEVPVQRNVARALTQRASEERQ